ncbi:MAG TPA: methionyl-tRNA formyltransferase [Ignavibacteria bacterium]|nr:methionyl-tRNA formyltransferase [Ignavibacteria bacterium]
MMDIVFMGTPEFAVPSLKILDDSGYNIKAVVTVPDKPKGRGLNVQESDVKKFAKGKNYKILQPAKLNDDEFINKLRELNADLFVVVAFRILPEKVYTIPRLGTFNLHASLLPKYRGAAPINWAIMNGDKTTGVTTFFLDKSVDTGKIIEQREIEISNDDTAGTLHDKLKVLGAETVLSTVKKIESGNVELIAQDNSRASKAPKIFKDGCRIDWTGFAIDIHNKIRGLSPYPTAWTLLKYKNLKIFKSKLTEITSNEKPGYIDVTDNKILVNTSDKKLEILELQLEGKKRMSSEEFLRGYKKENLIKFE